MLSLVAFRLDLALAWQIHLVFHVLNLKRFHRSRELEREARPPPSMVVNGEEEYEVERFSSIRTKEPGAYI